MKPTRILVITTILACAIPATASPISITCKSPISENGERHGIENCEYSNGTMVSTEWKNGKRDGKQIWNCPDGTRKELEWENDDPKNQMNHPLTHPGPSPC